MRIAAETAIRPPLRAAGPFLVLSAALPVLLALSLSALAADAVPAAAVTPAQFLSLPLPWPFPPVRVLTMLVGIHLIGLCLGLGGATMLDFWLVRWMRWGGLPPEVARTFMFISKVVSIGLAMLWFSGLSFLVIYALESPDKLMNPKLWAKIAIVLALTVNGVLIHAMVLPGIVRDVSRPIFEGATRSRTGVFLVSGAVSGVSWYSAFALGLLREFNGRVGVDVLLGVWFVGVIAASLGAYAYWRYLRRHNEARVNAAASETSHGDALAHPPFPTETLSRARSGILVSSFEGNVPNSSHVRVPSFEAAVAALRNEIEEIAEAEPSIIAPGSRRHDEPTTPLLAPDRERPVQTMVARAEPIVSPRLRRIPIAQFVDVRPRRKTSRA